MKQQEKTNVMRLLDSKGIQYRSFTYEKDPTMSGEDIAQLMGEEPARVFKTLVARGKTGSYYVFVIPVICELDLKKAAKSVGEKAVSMIKQKELLPLTGYVHGGWSPLCMKKYFRTVFDASAEELGNIYFSAGRVGCQVEVEVFQIEKIIHIEFAELTAGLEDQSSIM